MNAEIITIGTEILLGQIVDTNSVYLSEKLAKLGINVFYKTAVGDNLERITNALKTGASRADLLILTGGLGPTVDDITRQAVADFVEKKLIFHPEAFAKIKGFFKERNYKMPESNQLQACFPEGALILENLRGTAPGFILEKPLIIACLPGVPSEMKYMFSEKVTPFLLEKLGSKQTVILSKVLKIAGLGESLVDEKIKLLFVESKNPSIGILALPDEIILRLTAKAGTHEDAQRLIHDLKLKIYKKLGNAIYGEDEETLEGKIGEILRARNLTLSTAESCTSGLISHRITKVAGSSSYYKGGFNTYSNEMKINFLGVLPKTIHDFGAVSKECAREMAQGCAKAAQTDISIAVTGIAGPGGGSEEKPVGLVYIALSFKGQMEVKKFIFPGSRENIRERAAQTALFLIYQKLEKE